MCEGLKWRIFKSNSQIPIIHIKVGNLMFFFLIERIKWRCEITETKPQASEEQIKTDMQENEKRRKKQGHDIVMLKMSFSFLLTWTSFISD